MPPGIFSRGLSPARVRVISIFEKQVVVVVADEYYVLTKTGPLTNERIHPNTGTPLYNVKHEFTDLVSKSHTLLDDIGTNTHAQIDTHIAANQASTHGGNQNLTTTDSPTFNVLGLTGLNVGSMNIATDTINALLGDLRIITDSSHDFYVTSNSMTFTDPAGSGNNMVFDVVATTHAYEPDNSWVLGTALSRIKTIYLLGSLSDGTNALTVANAKDAYDKRVNTWTSPVLFSSNTASLAGLTTLGTANYMVGANSGATAWEYKQVIAGDSVRVTHGTGSITLAAVNALIGNTAAGTFTAGTTTYITWAGAGAGTVEAQRNIVFPVAGTLKNLYVNVAVNSLSGNAVFTVRKDNATPGSPITLTVAAAGTGGFSDTSNSTAIIAGSLSSLEIVTDAGSGSMSRTCWGVQVI